jgi:hypothetical protein
MRVLVSARIALIKVFVLNGVDAADEGVLTLAADVCVVAAIVTVAVDSVAVLAKVGGIGVGSGVGAAVTLSHQAGRSKHRQPPSMLQIAQVQSRQLSSVCRAHDEKEVMVKGTNPNNT